VEGDKVHPRKAGPARRFDHPEAGHVGTPSSPAEGHSQARGYLLDLVRPPHPIRQRPARRRRAQTTNEKAAVKRGVQVPFSCACRSTPSACLARQPAPCEGCLAHHNT
jgi:hypothetical protein